jgi:hypothetical protein
VRHLSASGLSERRVLINSFGCFAESPRRDKPSLEHGRKEISAVLVPRLVEKDGKAWRLLDELDDVPGVVVDQYVSAVQALLRLRRGKTTVASSARNCGRALSRSAEISSRLRTR